MPVRRVSIGPETRRLYTSSELARQLFSLVVWSIRCVLQHLTCGLLLPISRSLESVPDVTQQRPHGKYAPWMKQAHDWKQ
jgi:hypothetical protein